MGKVLAVVEQRDGSVRSGAREVMSAAARLAEATGGEADALLIGGPGVAGSADQLREYGAETIRVVEHEALATYAGEDHARVVADEVRAGDWAAVLFSATIQGKDLAPRVAALLDVPLAQDATAIEAEGDRFEVVRPVYAGKAFARVRIDASPVLASLRPNVFPAEERQGAGRVENVSVEVDLAARKSRVVEFEAAGGDIPDVAEAAIVVSGGRGMKDPEHWHHLETLREALGPEAGLGASRAVVDAGWRPHPEQVGQTGKTVAPKLYFAIGISGAIQHLAGMRTAGIIVAVNKDAEAPIFKVADYGVVGDLFEVVPRLAEEIRMLRAEG